LESVQQLTYRAGTWCIESSFFYQAETGDKLQDSEKEINSNSNEPTMNRLMPFINEEKTPSRGMLLGLRFNEI
jgi:hypothetical protein